MEKELNIAAILKDKPEGTKLWTDMFGSVTLYVVTDACDAFQVKHHHKEPWFDKEGKLCKEGVLCIYPSKSMRNWEKFAWEKGDVLVSNDGKREVLFKTWVNDSYTKFVGLHCLITNDNEEVIYDKGTTVFNTNDFKSIEVDDAAQTYINTIEKRLGGKLNLKTLEIEKNQPEFKDGDIVFMREVKSEFSSNCIFILRGEYNGEEKALYHAFYNAGDKFVCAGYGSTRVHYNLRSATYEERQRLFDALAKENKKWDAEQKAIVDLKPKVELKPFDRVLCRDGVGEKWRIDLFASVLTDNREYNYKCMINVWKICIPYKGNEHLLGTTKDVEG